MGRKDDDELREDRDAEITRRMNEKHAAMRAAILAGDKPTIKDVSEMVLDYVAGVPVPVVMMDRISATERALAKLYECLMLDLCEVEAVKEIEQIEADNRGGLNLKLMAASPAADPRVLVALDLIERSRAAA